MDIAFINLCPHPITLCTYPEPGSAPVVLSLPKCDNAPRIAEARYPAESIRCDATGGEVNCYTVIYGAVLNMPPETPGIVYIVPSMILDYKGDSYTAARNDLAAPGMQVRDETGRVIGAEGLRFRHRSYRG